MIESIHVDVAILVWYVVILLAAWLLEGQDQMNAMLILIAIQTTRTATMTTESERRAMRKEAKP